MRNLAPSPVIVSLAPINANLQKQGGAHTKPNHTYSIRLSVSIQDKPFTDTQTYIGFTDRANENRDVFDFSKAPPIGPFVRLASIENGERLAGNFKPVNEEGQFWDFELDGNLGKTQATIKVEESGQRPTGFQLYISDKDLGSAIALANGQFSIDLPAGSEARSFRILIATASYANEHREGIPLEPVDFFLESNYPNPFNPETSIRYRIGEQCDVRLDIFNILGQRVRTLVDASQEAGAFEVKWDGLNDAGTEVRSGIYLYRLNAGEFVQSRKMLLIRQ